MPHSLTSFYILTTTCLVKVLFFSFQMKKHACHSIQLNFYAKYPSHSISQWHSCEPSYIRTIYMCVIAKQHKTFFPTSHFYRYTHEIFFVDDLWASSFQVVIKVYASSFWYCQNFPNDYLLNFSTSSIRKIIPLNIYLRYIKNLNDLRLENIIGCIWET